MDDAPVKIPSIVTRIERETEAIGFRMASARSTGALLRSLAATKPAGTFLELGTGTGLATAWLLDGMDRDSRLITVENDPVVVEIARNI